MIGSVVDAISSKQHAIRAGETITIFGLGLGGSAVAQTGPPQVYFDGIPSDLLYESATQINMVVPMTVKQTTTHPSGVWRSTL